MFFRPLFLFILTFTVSFGAKKAYAYSMDFRPILRCSEDQSIFMIQFGFFDDSGTRKSHVHTIPPYRNLWSSLSPAEDGTCKIETTKAIQLSSKRDYESGKFSLKIADHYAYSDTAFFSENPQAVYDFNTVIIFQNGTLTECRKVTHKTDQLAVLCNNEARRLHDDIDGQERERQRRFNVAKDRGIVDEKPSTFCESLKPLQLRAAYQYKRPTNQYETDFLIFEEERSYGLHATFTDINDDGETDLIYRIAGYSESFYGSFLATFLNTDEFKTGFEADYKIKGLTGSTEKWFELPKWKDNLFSGGMAGSSVRYVYNRPVRLNGKSYIFTSEAVREKIPSEILYEVNADGTKTPVCVYP